MVAIIALCAAVVAIVQDELAAVDGDGEAEVSEEIIVQATRSGRGAQNELSPVCGTSGAQWLESYIHIFEEQSNGLGRG